MRNSHLIAPVLTIFNKWLRLAHHRPVVVPSLRVEIRFLELDRHTRVFLQLNVNLAILFVETDVHPGAFVVLHWSFDHASFSVFRPLGGSDMMRSVQRVHQSGKSERW